ncbi:MAG: hypothetical protein J6X60_06360 [Ruminiclostridium sp.]|nr:hypothetical protein [Ruminiclostridium sp.]
MKKTYQISVKLLSALHINGGTDINGNRITVKTDGNAYIPASLIKGMVRENFTKLWKTAIPDAVKCKCECKTDVKQCGCMTCRMFGASGFCRSRIYFDHLESTQELHYGKRSNVSIDRHTRKAVDKALVFTEVVEPRVHNIINKATPCLFTGTITVFYPPELSEKEKKQIEAVFVQSVGMITNIGLGKSRGLGFVETTVDEPEGGWLCGRK